MQPACLKRKQMRKQIAVAAFPLKFQAALSQIAPEFLMAPLVKVPCFTSFFHNSYFAWQQQKWCWQQANVETTDKVFLAVLGPWRPIISGWLTQNEQVLQMEGPWKNYSQSFPQMGKLRLLVISPNLLFISSNFRSNEAVKLVYK